MDVNGNASTIFPLELEEPERHETPMAEFIYTCSREHGVWSNEKNQ